MGDKRHIPIRNRDTSTVPTKKFDTDKVIEDIRNVLKKHNLDTDTSATILHIMYVGYIQQDTINKTLFALQQIRKQTEVKKDETTMDDRSRD